MGEMQLLIISIGKPPEPEIQQLIDDYQQRLSKHCIIKWQFVQASKSNDESQIRHEESMAILKQLQTSDQVILLDERGTQHDNQAFKDTFTKLSANQGRLIFAIGGAYGVSDELRQRANFVWSLSKLVFPHRLIRLILIEQIYRTVMITQNHPYHHK